MKAYDDVSLVVMKSVSLVVQSRFRFESTNIGTRQICVFSYYILYNSM